MHIRTQDTNQNNNNNYIHQKKITHAPTTSTVCMFYKFHLTFSKTKTNVNGHLHFLLKCHLNVTCLVVRVVSISKASTNVWVSFLHKSHNMSKSKLCMSIDVHFIFCASFCISNAKNLQKLCQKYTLHFNFHLTYHKTTTLACHPTFIYRRFRAGPTLNN